MFLSIATTHRPASDLGFLLHKHPERVHEVELAFGGAWVVYPEASEGRCEATLMLDADPVGLVRGKGKADGLLDQYVNDRPYAASSLEVRLQREVPRGKPCMIGIFGGAWPKWARSLSIGMPATGQQSAC